jgi:hypothetical protein
MKRLQFIIILLLFICFGIKGQWYTEKYGVSKVRDLSIEQLKESLSKAQETSVIGGALILTGGILVLAGEFGYRNGLPEDATFWEQLLGSQFMKGFYKGTGVGLAGVGVITALVGLSRTGNLKRVLDEKLKMEGNLAIKPIMFSPEGTGRLYPGMSLKIRF